MRQHHARPRLEMLEDRCVPALALTLNAAGQLSAVTGTTTEDVVVSLVADDMIKVEEGATDLGTNPASAKLKVILGNTTAADPDLSVDLNGFHLNADVSIAVGTTTFGFGIKLGDGSFEGDVKVKAGNGPDNCQVGSSGGATISGNVKVMLGGNADTLTIADSFLNGTLTVRGAQSFFVENSSVVGFLSFDAHLELRTVAIGMSLNTILFGGARVVTSVGGDVVDLEATIHGTARFALGGGNDTFTVYGTNMDGLFVDGGAGLDAFITTVPIDFPIELINFL